MQSFSCTLFLLHINLFSTQALTDAHNHTLPPSRARQRTSPSQLTLYSVLCVPLQQVVQGMKRQPAVWNEVFSDPPTTEPNAALPGTIIQNWHASTSGSHLPLIGVMKLFILATMTPVCVKRTFAAASM